MLKVLLTRTESDNGVWLTLPATPADIGEAYARLDNMNSTKNLKTYINGVESSIPNLQKYLMKKRIDDINTFQELNFIARRIDGFIESEKTLFSGALDIASINVLANIINLINNLEKYKLYPDVSTSIELGKYLVENDIIRIHESAVGYIDFEKVANEYEANNSGTYTSSGYVMKTGHDMEQVYDGVVLPDADIDKHCIFSLKLISHGNYSMIEKPYILKLPTSDTVLRKARDQLNVKCFDECEILEFESPISSLSSSLNIEGDIYSLNVLAKKINDILQENMIERFLAAVESENTEFISDALDIADNVAKYELIPASVITATDYAYYVLFDSGRYDIFIDDEINSFVDYEKYGNYKMEEDGIEKTSFGFIRRIDEPSQEQEQGLSQNIGGM